MCKAADMVLQEIPYMISSVTSSTPVSSAQTAAATQTAKPPAKPSKPAEDTVQLSAAAKAHSDPDHDGD